MTLTLNQAFREYMSRIELNPTRVELASQRYNSVKARIELALPGHQVKQIGSFQRNTKIRPSDLSDRLDIDVLVIRGPAYWIASPGGYGITPHMALSELREALVSDGTYRVMNPRTDAPTVVLEYADGFAMEFVPAFADKTGLHPHGPGEPDCYLVGTSGGNWVAADYDYDAMIISRLNALCDRELVPAIKMIKAFLRTYGAPLKSFHIEVLCALTLPNAIAAWRTNGWRWGYHHLLAYFLSNAHRYLNSPIRLPGSYSAPVDSDLNTSQLREIGAFLSRLGEWAWWLCERGDVPEGLSGWREFMGHPFPR